MLPVAPVLAQTGTTSTSTTSSTSSTSTTMPTTTTTTQPATTADADPPGAFLAGASGEVQGELGSYCWAPPGVRRAGAWTRSLRPPARR